MKYLDEEVNSVEIQVHTSDTWQHNIILKECQLINCPFHLLSGSRGILARLGKRGT